jgi:hypothetical protein
MATVTGSKRHLDITSDTLTTSSNVDVGAKLFITTTDSNTSSTTALVLNSTEVEARTLGSNAFNSTAFLTSETFSSSDVALSLGGNDIIAGTSITLAGGLSYNDSTSTLSQTDNNTTYSAGTLLDLSGTTFNVDLTELTNNTATFAPTQDHFLILDNGVQGKKLASSIFGSAAYEASSSFATVSHAHGGVYVPEYEALQPAGSDKEMNVWRKTHAVYSDNGGISTYIVIQTEVPQDNASMGGFTLVYQDEYNSGGEGGEIKIYGYWNPESNGGFVGFRYECSNPYHTPTIEVCRNSASGNTAFFISGEGGNYTQLIAKDLWLGYSATSATQQWGNGWVISEASAKTGYTNFDTLNRNDFAAITTDGSTPSLTGGVSAAEVRTLIGAGTSSSDTTYSAGTGLTLTNTTFSVTANTYAAASHNHDDRYTSTDGTGSDYRWSINLGSGTGTRWYKVGTVNTGSGGMTLRGLLSNHVESFATQQFDIAIQGRENNVNGAIEITGNVNVLYGGVGVLVVSGEQPGSYLHWDVYIVTTNYSMAEIDLTKTSSGFHTSYSYETSKPSGDVELDTTTLAEGNYVIDDSVAREIYHEGHKPTLAELGAASTAIATTSANGLMSSTDKTKLDGVESGADVTDSTNVATAGALMATGGTLSGTVKVTGSIIYENDTDSGYIPFPKGAQYQTKTNSHTGAIKITLPTHGGDDMVKWVVDIYDYTTGESVTMFMGGYIYQATGGNEWVSCTVTTLTEHSSKDYTVRFGADGTNSCVWIGETNSTWSYPQVIVRDFYAGFISDIDAYDDNWSISFVTSFATVDEVISDNLPTADWDRIEGKPGNATTSANGLMSSTDKTKLDSVASNADVTPSWVPASDPSYLTALPTHSHNNLYYTEDEIRLALARTNGWEAGYGSGTASNIKWNLTEEALELRHDSDSSIGAVYKAVWMEAGETKRWTVMIRGSQVTSNGMYIRLYQHDGNLPDGKTHVSNDAQGTFVQEDDRGDIGWYENGAISDSWTVFEREYKAPSAGYVSLVVLNWTGNGTESLFIKNPDIQTVYAKVESGSIGITELAVSDGTNGQVLTTNGSGTLSFATVSSGSADTNYYLDGITRTDSTDTLVFSVNGATSQSYTFGSNAFTSYTDHTEAGYLTTETYTAHEDTSTLNGTYGSVANGTKIDEITIDANGHITNITTGATGNMTGFFVEDGDGTEVQINNGNEWKFVEGTGIDINWTDTSAGSDTDPYDLTITCTIDSPGEVGLGNLSSSGNALAGTFTATGDLIAYSDARVKENVETIPNALEKVTALRGVNFNKIGEEKRSTGVIAQEVAEVIPEVVHESEDGMLGVAYGNITGLLIEAIKEQQKQIDELKAKLDGSTK